MFLGDTEHYVQVGLSAIDQINRALVDQPDPTAVLDYAGGYGRVLRLLQSRFPEAKLFHADVVAGAGRFAAREFGAEALMTVPDPGRAELPSDLGLIWCGSLLTHLEPASIAALIRRFGEALTPTGVAIVTTHGAFASNHEWTLAPILQ